MSTLFARLRRAGLGWVSLGLALLLAAALVGYQLGRARPDPDRLAELDGSYHLAPPSAVGFDWASLPGAPPVDDPRVDLVRAWVEAALTLPAYHATYPGFAEATSPDVAPLPVSRIYHSDSLIGTFRLDLAALSAGAETTDAVVCLDTLDVAGVSSGVGYLRTEWYGLLRLDLRFERTTTPGRLASSYRLDGRMPTDQPIPPPDVFAGWVLVSGHEVSDRAPCAASWAARHWDGFSWDGLRTPIPTPPFENRPGW